MAIEQLTNKVSLKLYIAALAIQVSLGGWYWYTTGFSLIWFAVLILATLSNHYMLVSGLMSLSQLASEKPPIFKIIAFLTGKTLIIGLAMYLVLRFAPPNIYIALALYIFQLIILLISIKKESQKI